MIDLKGGLQNLVVSRPFLRHLFRYYALYGFSTHLSIPVAIANLEKHRGDR